MKQTFLLVASFVLAKLAFSQINESDTAKLQLRATLTGNYQKGNVDVLTLRSKLELSLALADDVVFKSQNSSLYQSFYSVKADNDVFSRNYFYYGPQHRIYSFAIAYVSTNYRRKINTRYFTGVGFTYQLLNKPLHVLKLSTSAVYEQTKFAGTSFNHAEYNGSNRIGLWRETLYAGGWNYLFQNCLRFSYDAYWQPAFNNRKNYRTQVDAGLDFPVWKGLSFTMLYTFTHENVVITKVKQEDTILTFGITYNLKIKK